MYNNVNIRNGCYGYDTFKKDGTLKKFEAKGKAITLDEIYYSIEDGNTVWRISFEYLGEPRHYEFPRCNISDKKFVAKLQGFGADITTRTFDYFVDSMRLQESRITSHRGTFQHLGWIKLPINGQLEYCFRCTKLIGGRSAEYAGNLALKPKGSLDDWISMVKAEVLGRPQLETILLAALSAPIVGLHGINTTTDNPIYHINFCSGRGKSTACSLAASTAGEPFEGKRIEYDEHCVLKEKSSILGSWGATPKATISAHAGNRGIPVILNELGKFVGSDMTTVVFNLSEGSDIKRLNTQLETLVSEGFNTVFISCGEMSLIDRCKSKLEGIRNRVLEITMPMTEDAEHARRIKDGYINNSGFAVPMIAKYIVENGGFEMIQEKYSEVLQELTASAPEGVSDRFVEKFPTFLVMAARIAKQAMGLDFDEKSVVDFCYDCALQGKEEEGDVCESFDEVVGYFDVHLDNFFDSSRKDHTPKIIWGRVDHLKLVQGDRMLVKKFVVYPDIMKQIIKDLGYPNPSTELRLWRDKGILVCDDKHLTSKAKVNPKDTAPQRAYGLNVWTDAPIKSASKSNVKFLLEQDTDPLGKEVEDNEIFDCKRDCENA